MKVPFLESATVRRTVGDRNRYASVRNACDVIIRLANRFARLVDGFRRRVRNVPLREDSVNRNCERVVG